MSNNPQIYHGEWWVPAVADRGTQMMCLQPEGMMGHEKKYMGTLTYYGDEDSTLELYHVPSNFHSKHYCQNDVIWGRDANGHIFTLFNVTMKEPRMEDFTCTKFAVTYILLGEHILSVDDEKFNICRIYFPYLENWVIYETKERYIDSLSQDVFHLDVPIGNYKLLEAEIDENYVWELNHTNAVRRDLKGYQVIPSTYFDIRPKHLGSLRSFLLQIEEFSQFLSIAFYGQQNPERIDLVINGKTNSCEFLFKRGISYNPELSSLVKFVALKDKLPSILSLWHDNFNKMAPISSYLIDSLQRKNRFEVPDFLIIAQALDGYHKRFVNKKDGSDVRQYEEQIKILLRQFKDVKAIKACKIDPVVLKDSRHKYSHLYPDDEKSLAVEGKELYWLTEKCKILLTCCILNMLGLNNKEINLCCERSPISQIIDSFPLEID